MDPVSLCQHELYEKHYNQFDSFLNTELSDSTDISLLKTFIFEHIRFLMASKKTQMPDFGEDFSWLNTSRPLGIEKDLGKKLFVMDFFTYCCINCAHILPYLKQVETKYANNTEFAVIGVHSPKFETEKSLEQVKEAVLRNRIKHPVVNDKDSVLWGIFNITCWPTVFIVGPRRIVLFTLVGEKQIEKLQILCEITHDYLRLYEGEMDFRPLPISEIKEPDLFPGLLYPGNVSTNGQDILVSDTGHNRLLLMSRSLRVKEIIGSGLIGEDNGSFNSASFNSPHGTTWHKDVAYVADTGNHSIRKIDFEKKCVSTLCIGKNLFYYPDNQENPMTFRSPWDVCVGCRFGGSVRDLNSLYIAVAGSHQIWVLDLEIPKDSNEFCMPFAGSGKEENRPNLYRMRAGFAQPSGIVFSQSTLFIADSENSTIKSISLLNGSVKVMAGGGLDPTDLFEFGDQDGEGRNAKLQHPMSLCVLDWNTLVVADTYNHKLKLLYINKCTLQTVPKNYNLNEPSGACILDNMVVVADTNNHRIVNIPIDDLTLDVVPKIFEVDAVSFNLSPKELPETHIILHNEGKIFCTFIWTPNGNLALNKAPPQKLEISFKGSNMEAVYKQDKFLGVEYPLVLKSSTNSDRMSGVYQPCEVKLVVSLPMCHGTEKVCSYKKVLFKIVIDYLNIGAKTVGLQLYLHDESKLCEELDLI